jgi:hypothetical protein
MSEDDDARLEQSSTGMSQHILSCFRFWIISAGVREMDTQTAVLRLNCWGMYSQITGTDYQ